MIEIIREESWDSTQEKIGLPKNIKQIGTPDIGERIYIENSTYQYMHSYHSSIEKNAYVLLGRFEEYGGRKCTFIEAAILLEEICFDGALPVWNDQTWAYLYRRLNHAYDEMVIVGWAMDIRGQLPNLTAPLETLHRTHFGGMRQLLFLMDSLEGEENFYTQKNGRLSRREGYYIYYDKSIPERLDTAMDMLCQEKLEREEKKECVYPSGEPAVFFNQKEEILLETDKKAADFQKEWNYGKTESRNALYRNYLKEQTEKKLSKPAYSSTLLLAVVALALGMAALHNYEKMNAMEETLAKMNAASVTAQGTSGTASDVSAADDNGVKIETVSGSVSKNADGDNEIADSQEGGMQQAAETAEQNAENGSQTESNEQNAENGSQTESNEQNVENGSRTETGAQNEEDGGQTEADGLQDSGAADDSQTQNSTSQSGNGDNQQGDSEAANSNAENGDANQTENSSDSNVTETMTESQQFLSQGYYIVQKGESLVGICKKIYQTTAMLDKLCEVNDIEDPDAIYEGQKLILPN